MKMAVMTKRILKLMLPGCLGIGSCTTARPVAQADPTAARRAIVEVLTTQTAAWNRGDIPGFMQGYWQSDSLVFIGRKGPTYGYFLLVLRQIDGQWKVVADHTNSQ